MERKENFQVQFLREVDDEPVRSIVNRMECFAIKGSEEKLRIWLQRETNKEIKIITPKNVTQEKFPNYTPLDKSFLSKEELKILYQKHEEDFRLYRLAK
ncbi:MAG: hypothetical protein C0617_11720 [Desulfuromonas sp.]|nr:MAG: hypothetical protein C0617_11720 [Desulfuromonas sp.]